jgi:hypothetical protein
VEALEASPEAKGSIKEIEASPPKKSLLKNWPLMSSIIVYCIFSLHDMAYTEVIYIYHDEIFNFISYVIYKFHVNDRYSLYGLKVTKNMVV